MASAGSVTSGPSHPSVSPRRGDLLLGLGGGEAGPRAGRAQSRILSFSCRGTSFGEAPKGGVLIPGRNCLINGWARGRGSPFFVPVFYIMIIMFLLLYHKVYYVIVYSLFDMNLVGRTSKT